MTGCTVSDRGFGGGVCVDRWYEVGVTGGKTGCGSV